MTIPNVASAPPTNQEGPGGANQNGSGEGNGANGVASGDNNEAGEEEANDGLTPEMRRKFALEDDPDFKKYIIMNRNKIPLFRIHDKIKMDGKYETKDIDLFATEDQIKEAYLPFWKHEL